MSEHSGFKLKSEIDFNKITSPIPVISIAASNASVQAKRVANFVCDGTDDIVEIRLAIAALPVNGGKVVLSEGTFNVKVGSGDWGWSLGNNIIFEGQGKSSILNVDATSAGALIVITGSNNSVKNIKFVNNASTYQHCISLLGAKNCIIEGNYAQITSAGTFLIIHGDVTYLSQDNIITKNTVLGNISAAGGIICSSALSGRNIRNEISYNIVENMDSGISIQDNNQNVIGNIIKNCVGTGISISAAFYSNILGNIITDCYRGIYANQSYTYGNVISGNEIGLSKREGIFIDDNNAFVISDNILKDNCQDANDTYSELYMKGNKQIISNNNILCTQSNKAKYGIELFNGDNSNIIGNVVRGAVTTQIILSGTIVGIIKEHNIELA